MTLVDVFVASSATMSGPMLMADSGRVPEVVARECDRAQCRTPGSGVAITIRMVSR